MSRKNSQPQLRATRARRITLGLAVLFILIVGLIGIQPAHSPSQPSQTALDPAILPTVLAEDDTTAVELGLRFSSSVDGTVQDIKFFKGSSQNEGPHTGSIWTSSGRLLARTTFINETATGWQTAKLPNTVPIVAGRTYVVSYHAPHGRYSMDNSSFVGPSGRKHLTLPAAAGVYAYGSSGFPSSTHRDSNYYVDVTFTPCTVPPAPPATTKAERPAQPATGTVRPVDGGANYYASFGNPLPTDPSFFPIGVWFESILSASDIARDRAAGLNLYVELTDDSDTKLLGSNGPYAITSAEMSGVSGRITTDEADMWGGPGTDAWTGNYPGEGDICFPAHGRCGYSIMQTARDLIPSGVMAYSNYGKGVTFWGSDDEAGRFVNEFQDVVSADNYWFTDPNICGYSEGGRLADGRSLTQAQCRLAANYGWTIDRMRSLVHPVGSKPIWAFVEVGHPFTENEAPTITGPQIRAAVWSSIIHGARGVIYFNHSFGGACISQHVLRDECGEAVRPTVTALNRQIIRLAPVLNAPFLDGVTTSVAAIDHMTKVYDGQIYVFAASAQAAPQKTEISNACMPDGTVTVVGENRTLTASAGSFSDEFTDGNAVHIYSAPVDARCDR